MFQIPTETYSGRITEVKLGIDPNVVTLGGETTLAFQSFEGELPHRPAVAMEVFDNNPQDWPQTVAEPFKDVLSDPVKWALRCEKEYGADLICLQLASTDPNRENHSPAEAAETVKAVLDAISIPLIIYGCGDAEKDKDVLEKAATAAAGKNIAIGPATEENYKTVAAAAMAFNQNVIALTPCDVNLAKQLNILLVQMGLPRERIIIDPSTGALGYGLDYTYTIIERLKLAALQQGDEMTRMPIICNLGIEVWKVKEAKASNEEEPNWGSPQGRGISWETMTALSLAVSGANLLVMRHPQAVANFKKAVKNLLAQ